MKTLLLHGMHGMGDNIHQRAIIRRLMLRYERIILETSWPCIYHDLPVTFLFKGTNLRTQSKNALRERDKFFAGPIPTPHDELRVWYPPREVRRCRSVLRAMAAGVGLPECEPLDFRLPIPAEWTERARRALGYVWDAPKPIMLFRPLVERTEWGGCSARNPDWRTYAELYESIRERFFVVAVADLVEGREWSVGLPFEADAYFMRGELPFEVTAALTRRASMVFCSPGFAAVLGQSVGTPVACVFGGYESGYSFSSGSKFAPYLPIEPIQPCECFRHDHDCSKQIDATAFGAIGSFALESAARPRRD